MNRLDFDVDLILRDIATICVLKMPGNPNHSSDSAYTIS